MLNSPPSPAPDDFLNFMKIVRGGGIYSVVKFNMRLSPERVLGIHFSVITFS